MLDVLSAPPLRPNAVFDPLFDIIDDARYKVFDVAIAWAPHCTPLFTIPKFVAVRNPNSRPPVPDEPTGKEGVVVFVE